MNDIPHSCDEHNAVSIFRDAFVGERMRTDCRRPTLLFLRNRTLSQKHHEYKAQFLVSGAFLPQFPPGRRTVTCKAMADCKANVAAMQGDCSWLTVISESKLLPPGRLYPRQPSLAQLTRHSASMMLSVALTAFGLGERKSLGWMFGLKICQFDTCLFHLTVCTCVHCWSLCVLRVYVCVYMSVNCIVYFSSMIWPLIVLRKRKHNGSLSISFHIFFFLMSLPSRLTHSEFSFHRK